MIMITDGAMTIAEMTITDAGRAEREKRHAGRSLERKKKRKKKREKISNKIDIFHGHFRECSFVTENYRQFRTL